MRLAEAQNMHFQLKTSTYQRSICFYRTCFPSIEDIFGKIFFPFFFLFG